MKNRLKRMAAAVLSLVMVCGLLPGASAADVSSFKDIPEDWSKDAIVSAVENDLLRGDGEGYLNPGKALSRVEMATVLNRAFGAATLAEIKFEDVQQGAWYYPEIQKAVAMGTFQGTSATQFSPVNDITRESAFVALARSLRLTGGKAEVLDQFSDKDEISAWALPNMIAMVENGYVKGSEGKLYPTPAITRAEFAQVMYNLFQEYVVKAGEVTSVKEGNVVVRVPGVTMKKVHVTGDLIVGDGANGAFTLENSTVDGRLLIRGGSKTAPVTVTGTKVVKGLHVYNPNSVVLLATDKKPTAANLLDLIAETSVILQGSFGTVTVYPDAIVTVKQGAKVEKFVFMEGATEKDNVIYEKSSGGGGGGGGGSTPSTTYYYDVVLNANGHEYGYRNQPATTTVSDFIARLKNSNLISQAIDKAIANAEAKGILENGEVQKVPYQVKITTIIPAEEIAEEVNKALAEAQLPANVDKDVVESVLSNLEDASKSYEEYTEDEKAVVTQLKGYADKITESDQYDEKIEKALDDYKNDPTLSDAMKAAIGTMDVADVKAAAKDYAGQLAKIMGEAKNAVVLAAASENTAVMNVMLDPVEIAKNLYSDYKETAINKAKTYLDADGVAAVTAIVDKLDPANLLDGSKVKETKFYEDLAKQLIDEAEKVRTCGTAPGVDEQALEDLIVAKYLNNSGKVDTYPALSEAQLRANFKVLRNKNATLADWYDANEDHTLSMTVTATLNFASLSEDIQKIIGHYFEGDSLSASVTLTLSRDESADN